MEGFRTLVFSKREIKEEDYQKWAKMYAASLAKLQKIGEKENKELKKSIIKSASSFHKETSQK